MEIQHNNHQMIPCKDCLILPICRDKVTVKCNLLKDWSLMNRLSITDHWKTIHRYISKAEILSVDERKLNR